MDQIISKEREARTVMHTNSFKVEEKTLDSMLIAGVRVRGKYSDCGRGFAQIGRRFGRHICGKPFMLHYDSEYKEDDADFEACMPIKKGDRADGIEVRKLPGGRCVALLHQGPYEELGRSYEKILGFVNEKGYSVQMPTREVYIKGSGNDLPRQPDEVSDRDPDADRRVTRPLRIKGRPLPWMFLSKTP